MQQFSIKSIGFTPPHRLLPVCDQVLRSQRPTLKIGLFPVEPRVTIYVD